MPPGNRLNFECFAEGLRRRSFGQIWAPGLAKWPKIEVFWAKIDSKLDPEAVFLLALFLSMFFMFFFVFFGFFHFRYFCKTCRIICVLHAFLHMQPLPGGLFLRIILLIFLLNFRLFFIDFLMKKGEKVINNAFGSRIRIWRLIFRHFCLFFAFFWDLWGVWEPWGRHLRVFFLSFSE